MDRVSSSSSPGELLERLIQEAEAQDGGAASTATTAEDSATEASEKPISTAPSIGGLLSDPTVLAALPKLLEGLGALSLGSGKSGAAVSDRHTALLCALKPYLGKERQESLAYLISFCRIFGTLQGMGLNLSSLLPSSVETKTEKEV